MQKRQGRDAVSRPVLLILLRLPHRTLVAGVAAELLAVGGHSVHEFPSVRRSHTGYFIPTRAGIEGRVCTEGNHVPSLRQAALKQATQERRRRFERLHQLEGTFIVRLRAGRDGSSRVKG